MTSSPAPFADQQLAEFVRSLAEHPGMSAAVDVEALRRSSEERASQRPPGPDMPTHDVAVPGGPVRVRVYRPSGHLDAVVVYLHGGGWTIGSLETHDRACRRLSARCNAMVAAVDYRLAPEHPAPAAIDDTVAALEWVATGPPELGGRPVVTVVAGDSAGGTLAALAAIRLRGRDAAPDVLALAYANTDLSASGGSMIDNAHGYGLDVADIARFNSLWVPDPDSLSDPNVSPLRVEDLAGVPDTIVVTCELDPLRDQGEAFGRRLADAGVPVMVRREPGMVHNFLLWDLIAPSCAAAADRFGDDICRAIERHRSGAGH
jgi:acetyl esterase/lipase